MENPIVVMVAITGKPSGQKIYEFLNVLKKNGIDNAMIYPRVGCEFEYLGDEWFSAVGNFLSTAEKLDMKLWLYDDFNWPSGDACGKVTAVEKFRLRAIKTRGEDIGTVSCKSMHNSDIFGEKFFPDLLSNEAVDYFIECTHEQYFKRFGKYFGNVISGIFTDEPAIGYSCTDNCIPYYDGIENDYERYCGRNFERDMAEGDKDFFADAMTVISRRFNKCFVSKIASWCQAHNVVMTGHLLLEDTPLEATRNNGNVLDNLSSFMMPGIDEISTNFEFDSEISLFGTGEYVGRKNGAMAELFALGPCDLTYAKKRCMIYLAACHKIKTYFLAVSHMDIRGNMHITDYFNDFAPDQPDFAGMKLLSEEAKRAAAYAKKDYNADVYIKYPFKLCSEKIIAMKDTSWFTDLINALAHKQIQWKYVNDEERTDAPVIEFNDNLEYVIGGFATDNIDAVCARIQRKVVVTDMHGGLPKGIFTRIFKDGSEVVLNLFAADGEYLINGEKVHLCEHDIFICGDENYYNMRRYAINTQFVINYRNDNMVRLMYLNGESDAKLSCGEDICVAFAVRKDVSAQLDGKEIKCDGDSGVLSCGLRDLYSVSDKIVIKSGVHMVSSENDRKYLPSVFVIGNFSAYLTEGEVCGVSLAARKYCIAQGEKFSDFGCVEQIARVTIPNNATAIELTGTKLYTRIYADGNFIGERIASPYIFNLNSEFQGRETEIKIEQYSSFGPIFGNTDYWDKNSESTQWRGTPSTKKTLFGFDEINFLCR